MLSDLVAEYWRRRAWLILAPILWLGCTALATAQAPPAPAGYPPFSWDTVPIAADFGKAPDQFTQEEGLFIARHFSLVSIEKGQAVGPSTQRPPYTEAGFLDAVPLIKLNNRNVKILFYWNTQIAFFSGVCAPLYTAFSVGYSPQWCEPSTDTAKWEWPCGSSTTTTACVMAGDSGSAQYSPMYDLTNTAFQQWWVTWAQAIVTGLYRPSPLTADGVFADHAPASPPLYSLALAMYQTLAGALPADSLLVYNGIQCGAENGTVCPLLSGSLEYLNSAFITGAMIEHFGLIGQEITTTGPQQAVMNALLALQPTSPPKIILFKGWPQTFSWQTLAKSPMTYAEQVKEARAQIIFPLACFLAVAQPYWYFDYSWGYAEPDAGVLTYQTDTSGNRKQPLALDLSWYPEFFKSLGAPTGPATTNSNGTQYSRQFAHASVICDVGTPKNSSTTWSSSQN